MKESGSVNTARSDMFRRNGSRTAGKRERAGQRKKAYNGACHECDGHRFFIRTFVPEGVIDER
jgi:hypothetical protein